LLQGLEFGERCLEIAERSQNDVRLSQAHYALGHIRCLQGDFVLADIHLEGCANSYSISQHPAHLNISGLDPGAFGVATHSWVHWFLGQPNSAISCINHANDLSAEIGHAQSQEHILASIAQCYLFGARYEDALQAISAALALAVEYGFEMRINMGRIIEFSASAKLNEAEPPQLDVIARLIDQHKATGAGALVTYYNSLHADAMMDTGDLAGAIAKIDDTFALGMAVGEHWWDAELHRLKGIAISRHKDEHLNIATDCMQRAIETAKSQSALTLQLRALCSLIELKNARDVQDEIEELRLTYDRCQLDTSWPDIATAGRLLAMHSH